MKITFFSYIYPYPDRGYNPGIERVVQEFATELVQQGNEVHVLTTYRNGGERKTDTDNGVRIHRVPDTRYYFGRLGSIFSLDFLSLNYSIRGYVDLLESSDVVHAFAPLVNKFFSTPLVAHYHHWDEPGSPLEYLYLPTSQRLWMRCYRNADQIIAVSNYSADDLASRGIDRENIAVVQNGVDTSRFHPGRSSIEFDDWDTMLLYVGPLVDRKGVHHLIRAMPDILEDDPDTGLVIVGSGNREELEDLASEMGVQENVLFTGFVSEEELPEYYRAADVFVFPSWLEGFGMVLIEAMASGLPVVSTNATAIPEVVGEAGILVPPRDSSALVEAVAELLHRDARTQFNPRTRVEDNFTWVAATERLQKVYSNLKGV